MRSRPPAQRRQTAAFIEVDLASMTQTLHKQKVARYLAYAADQVWVDRFRHCPPMLMITTTATRAATFARVGGQILAARHGGRSQRPGGDARSRGLRRCARPRPDRRRAVLEPDRARCARADSGRIAHRTPRRPSRIRRLVHRTGHGRPPQQHDRDSPGDTRVQQPARLARQRARRPSAPGAHRYRPGSVPRRRTRARRSRRRLVRPEAPHGPLRARDLAAPLVATLEQRHGETWAAQANQLLAAQDHITAEHPHVYRLAQILAAGNLATVQQMAELDLPPTTTRKEISKPSSATTPLGGPMPSIASGWPSTGGPPPRTREVLAAMYDKKHLMVCDMCALAVPASPEEENTETRCRPAAAPCLIGPTRASTNLSGCI